MRVILMFSKRVPLGMIACGLGVLICGHVAESAWAQAWQVTADHPPAVIWNEPAGAAEAYAALAVRNGGATEFRQLPVYDAVVLVAERSAIPLAPAAK